MPNQLQQVQAGDLITADLLNTMITIVNTLDQRVTVLEETPSTGTTIVPLSEATITRLDPPDEVAVNQELSVYGTNFGYTAGAARAFVGQTQVKSSLFKLGSSDTRLVFDVPNIPQTLPDTLVITVGNQFSTARRSILVKPADIAISGPVTVLFVSVTPSDTPQKSKATWRVQLTSHATKKATFDIKATVSEPTWQSDVNVFPTATSTTPITTVELVPEAAPTEVFVQVAIPDSTANTKFRLTVAVTAGAAVGSRLSDEYTVGQPSEPVDDKIVPDEPHASPAIYYDKTTKTITMPTAQSRVVTMTFNALLVLEGAYDVTSAINTTKTGSWTIDGSQNPPNPIKVSATQAAAGGINQQLDFDITAVSAGGPTDTAEIKIKRQGATGSAKLPFNLKNA